jgi:hypothetical protein
MLKVMYRSDDSYVSCRAGVYYYIRRVPYDVRQHKVQKAALHFVIVWIDILSYALLQPKNKCYLRSEVKLRGV